MARIAERVNFSSLGATINLLALNKGHVKFDFDKGSKSLRLSHSRLSYGRRCPIPTVA